jgi:RNA polymerase sigma factor (sigma-70 family)
MTTAHAHEVTATPGDCVLMPLADHIEELFSRSEPRLQRLARSQRVAPDVVEDIVQETLIEAWKSLDHLRNEARFTAWLDGICRNVCLRYQRRQGILRTREIPLAATEGQTDDEPDLFARLADPNTFDPPEELARHELVFLLDRALGYLPQESRMAVERHYLAEIPQRELAAQMGLSLSALEARLYRARGQMLRTFSRELRNEALALGLTVAPDDAQGWRETTFSCVFCGQVVMLGVFEPMADGRVNMRLRCPVCAVEINSAGVGDLSTARSFLPATKKVVNQTGRFIAAAMAAGGACRCWSCRRSTRLRVVRESDPMLQTWLQSDCCCLRLFVSAASFYSFYPAVGEFLFSPCAVLIEPEADVTFDGHTAIRFGLRNRGSGRLDVFADPQTLEPFAIIRN